MKQKKLFGYIILVVTAFVCMIGVFSYRGITASAKTEQADWYLIRRIDDYTSTEYWCKTWADTLRKEAFNHHESVTIPKELLTEDFGSIRFFVYAKPQFKQRPNNIDYPMEVLGECAVSYAIIDESVLLSSNSVMKD